MEYIAIGVTVFVLAAAGYRGYKAGVVKVALYAAALLFTIVIAGIFMKPVSETVKNNTSLYTNIEKSVESVIKKHEIQDIKNVKELPFPQYMLDEVEKMPGFPPDLTEFVAEAIAVQIFDALIYVCLNVVIYLIIRFAMGVLNIVTMLPVVKQANKLAGMVVGLAEGVIFLWLLCILLQACGSEPWAQEVFIQIRENEFLSWIYNHNVLTGFVSKIL